jgi:hypothetical protein
MLLAKFLIKTQKSLIIHALQANIHAGYRAYIFNVLDAQFNI